MSSHRPHQLGFTLIELISVIVITGILSFAVIRSLSRTTFDARGYADQVASMLRFAQKEAIAKRRSVCVNIATNATSGSSNVTLSFATAAATSCDPVAANNTALPSPSGDASFSRDAPDGIALAPLPNNFAFDPLGRPTAAQSITVSGDVSPLTITVESETGYVHY